MRERLAAAKVKEGISAIGLYSAEQRGDWNNLLMACGGLDESAARISEEISSGTATDVDPRILMALPESWKPCQELEDWLQRRRLEAIGAYGRRLAGMREAWEAGDPEVARFIDELSALGDIVPVPDEAIVERLAELGVVERVGRIIMLDGIPVAAGDRQIRAFVAIRWRWLIVQPNDLSDGFDDVNLSDGSMQQLLTYTATSHAKNLAELQRNHLQLFWAVWRRDLKAVRKLAHKAGKALRNRLVPLDPRLKSSVHPALHLMYGTAIMSELERLFEILECLHRANSITRASIDDLLKKSSSMADIHTEKSMVGPYLAGTFAQIRGSHRSMNKYVRCKSKDHDFRCLHTAVKTTQAYSTNNTRLRKPFVETPALHFIGIEQQFIPLAAIIMLIDNINRIMRNFMKRGSRGHSTALVTPNEAVKLAGVIAANVNPLWARALFDALARPESDDDWLAMGMPGRTGRSAESEAGERNHFRIYQTVRKRVDKLPRVHNPGWTRGFFFEAWLRPEAEVIFLRKCSSLSRFSKAARTAHVSRMKQVAAKPFRGFSGSVATTFTGLPLENPVEAAHERMRPFFDKIQYPDLIAPRFKKLYRKDLDAFVTEVAKVFPAVTPMTLDPHLNEQIFFSIDRDIRDFAIEAAWHTTLL